MEYEDAIAFVRQELEMLKQAGIVRSYWERADGDNNFTFGVNVGGDFAVTIHRGRPMTTIGTYAYFDDCERCFDCYPNYDISPAIIRAKKDIETGNYQYEWTGGAYYNDYDEDYDEETY